ncbi:hypothetical protein [Paracidovorax citrulli]
MLGAIAPVTNPAVSSDEAGDRPAIERTAQEGDAAAVVPQPGHEPPSAEPLPALLAEPLAELPAPGPIHALPLELVLRVAGYLPTGDGHALLQCSHGFRDCLGPWSLRARLQHAMADLASMSGLCRVLAMLDDPLLSARARSGWITQVAQCLPRFDRAVIPAALTRILGAIRALPAEERAAPLVALSATAAARMGALRARGRDEPLILMLLQLDPLHREEPLSRCLSAMPPVEGALAGHDLAAWLDIGVAMPRRTARGHFIAQLLKPFPLVGHRLSEAAEDERFACYMAAALRLRDDHGNPAAEQAVVLAALARHVAAQALVRQPEQPAHAQGLWDQLFDGVVRLPVEAQATAFEALLIYNGPGLRSRFERVWQASLDLAMVTPLRAACLQQFGRRALLPGDEPWKWSLLMRQLDHLAPAERGGLLAVRADYGGRLPAVDQRREIWWDVFREVTERLPQAAQQAPLRALADAVALDEEGADDGRMTALLEWLDHVDLRTRVAVLEHCMHSVTVARQQWSRYLAQADGLPPDEQLPAMGGLLRTLPQLAPAVRTALWNVLRNRIDALPPDQRRHLWAALVRQLDRITVLPGQLRELFDMLNPLPPQLRATWLRAVLHGSVSSPCWEPVLEQIEGLPPACRPRLIAVLANEVAAAACGPELRMERWMELMTLLERLPASLRALPLAEMLRLALLLPAAEQHAAVTHLRLQLDGVEPADYPEGLLPLPTKDPEAMEMRALKRARLEDNGN